MSIPSSIQTAIETLQQTSLPQLVRREVERMIIAGELSAGDKLNESTFALKLGISRGPVREAFRSLQETGLVRLEKNRGVFVRQVTPEEAAELYEVRAALEEFTVRKLAQTITEAQLAHLRAIVGDMEGAIGRQDAENYFSLNLAFHEQLIESTGNCKLMETYQRLANELRLYRRRSMEEEHNLPESLQEHRRILNAIANHDAIEAVQAMADHIEGGRARGLAANRGPLSKEKTG